MDADVSVEILGDTAIVVMGGELDLAAVPSIRRAVTDAMAMPVRSVVIHLAEATFLDASALGAITAGQQAARQRGLGYWIGDPVAPTIERVLKIVGSDLQLCRPERSPVTAYRASGGTPEERDAG